MQTVKFNVGGDGYWSTVKGSVEITDMRLGYINDERDFGELCVYFNDKHWDVNIDGLIYTDKQFMADLKAFLTAHGLSTDVSYSEQGMQGDDYVSCDIGQEFITAWENKFGVLVAE
jgi:hypothetical protein